MGLKEFVLISLFVLIPLLHPQHQASADQSESPAVTQQPAEKAADSVGNEGHGSRQTQYGVPSQSADSPPVTGHDEAPSGAGLRFNPLPSHRAGLEPVFNEKPPDFVTEPESPRIEAVIINPFRVAAVAGEVGGLVDAFHFELGDLVQHGQVVAEISGKRYRLVVKKARENVRALRVALDRARKDREIKARLFAMDVSSEQELGRAESDVEVVEHKVKEAEATLEQAELDVEACQVRAPFTGYLAARHKEPHEAVAPLDKLFTLVDNAKVFAVAYVPETKMGHFSKGKEAVFVETSGRQFRGQVQRVEPIIDPKTDTRKVFVLIDNAQHPLEIGMSGSLESLQ